MSLVETTHGLLNFDETPFESRWEKMRPVLNNLLCQNDVTIREWQQLFWDAHACILWDENGHIYLQEALTELIQERLQNIVDSLPIESDNLTLLSAYAKEWVIYRDQMQYLPGVFRSLEEEFSVTSETGEEVTIIQILLLEWKTIFVDYQDRLCNAASQMIKHERSGHQNDKAELIVALKETFAELSSATDNDIYESVWCKKYFEETESYYKQRADGVLLESRDTQGYMKFAHQALQDEGDRSDKYLLPMSKPKLMKLLTVVLVENNAELIQSECRQMIAERKVYPLRLMFSLLDRMRTDEGSSGIRPILTELEKNIFGEGQAALTNVINLNDGDAVVTYLLEHMDTISDLIVDAFDRDDRFTTARDKAFQRLMNDMEIFGRESRCPELLANHVDSLLRRKALSKKYSAEMIQERLVGVLLLLKYVHAKDIFMRHHKLHLTRRLILNMSNDEEQEERLVESLRDIGMPADYVNKLTRMFQDIRISQELNQACHEDLKKEMLNIKVLSAGAWVRGISRFPIQLPHEIEESIGDIDEFYKERHSGRKLHFHPLLSHGTLAFQSKLGKYELEVSAMQLSLLSSWNRRPNAELTVDDLVMATMLPEVELRKTLISLSQNPKLKIQLVLASPELVKGKDFSSETKFRINRAFALIKNGKVAPRGKVSLIGRLPLVAEKNTRKDEEDLQQLRALRIQEAALKILKSRKKISAAAFMSELIELLKSQFLPSKKLIKEQIEWLIEREYMERDPKSPLESYLYKA